MTTLTDRYVTAVTRGVPDKQRTDLERELRASLADAIDDRIDAGADAASAEHDAIVELGDPIVLAAGYSGRPLHLIGPAFYPDWKRLLTMLELIVVPIVLVTIPIVWTYRGESLGEAVGEGVRIAFGTAIQIAFWITVTFAIVERSSTMRNRALAPWTPDMLPETSRQLTSRREFIIETSLAALIAAALVLNPVLSPVPDGAGDPIPVLHPWGGSTGLFAALVAVLVVQVGANALKLRGTWTLGLAIGMIAVELVGAAILILLGITGRVLNPEFATAAGWPGEVVSIVNVCVIVAGALAIATSTWENLRPIRR